jgi:hypothetical protein
MCVQVVSTLGRPDAATVGLGSRRLAGDAATRARHQYSCGCRSSQYASLVHVPYHCAAIIAAATLDPLPAWCCYCHSSSTHLEQCTFSSACDPSLICVPGDASQLCATRNGNLLAVVHTRQQQSA